MLRSQTAAVVRVGPARFQPYLKDAHGDRVRALALYEWNSQLAAALWRDLGHLEVFLRNALDAQMQARHMRLGRVGDWLDDPAQELGRDPRPKGRHQQPYREIASARTRVRNNNKQPSHDQILSETTFGLWHQLVAAKQRFLWPDLANAFPHAPTRSHHHVATPLARLRSLRNRIAHHHRIVAVDISGRLADVLELLAYIDPDVRDWVQANSDVPRVKALRPSP